MTSMLSMAGRVMAQQRKFQQMQGRIAQQKAEQTRKSQAQPAQADAYAAFKARYQLNPAAFVRDCIAWPAGEQPAQYQAEILAAVPAHRRVSARGPHGLGKSAISAWLILWYALTRDGRDWKIPTTASVWRQLEDYLWPEIHKWSRCIRWDVVGRPPFEEGRELLQLSLNLSTGSAFALASDKPSNLEGAHADHILYLFDESKAIPDATFDAAEGAFSTTGEVFAVAVSTPGDRRGRFFDIHQRKDGYRDWWVRHVTMAEAVAGGRISAEWCEARKTQWGADSPTYINRVLGDFADEIQADGVIPRAWVKMAQARWQAMQAAPERIPRLTRYGVDVGLTADQTIFAPRHRNYIAELVRYPARGDTMRIVGELDTRVRQVGRGTEIVVDVIGIGAGVADRLRQMNHEVISFDAREKTDQTDSTKELTFINRRAQSYWHMRELLNPASGEFICLPPDKELEDDLCAPAYWQAVGGRLQVESKEELRKPDRLGRSPDAGDAVVMAFADYGPRRRAPVKGQGISVPE